MLSRANAVKIFRLEDADRTEVAELLAKGMPLGISAESWLQRFSQWWDRNPHAPNDWPRVISRPPICKTEARCAASSVMPKAGSDQFMDW